MTTIDPQAYLEKLGALELEIERLRYERESLDPGRQAGLPDEAARVDSATGRGRIAEIDRRLAEIVTVHAMLDSDRPLEVHLYTAEQGSARARDAGDVDLMKGYAAQIEYYRREITKQAAPAEALARARQDPAFAESIRAYLDLAQGHCEITRQYVSNCEALARAGEEIARRVGTPAAQRAFRRDSLIEMLRYGDWQALKVWLPLPITGDKRRYNEDFAEQVQDLLAAFELVDEKGRAA